MTHQPRIFSSPDNFCLLFSLLILIWPKCKWRICRAAFSPAHMFWRSIWENCYSGGDADVRCIDDERTTTKQHLWTLKTLSILHLNHTNCVHAHCMLTDMHISYSWSCSTSVLSYLLLLQIFTFCTWYPSVYAWRFQKIHWTVETAKIIIFFFWQ